MKNIQRNEAHHGGKVRKPSILNWYVEARKEVTKSGEEAFLMGLWDEFL